MPEIDQPSEAKPEGFLLMPFSPETADEDRDVFETVYQAITQAATLANVTIIRADEIYQPGVIINQIFESISRADFIVALCTGQNPNVYLELGYSYGMGHEPILIARSSEDISFDLAHLRFQLYGPPHSPEDLSERVSESIRAVLHEPTITGVALAVSEEATSASVVAAGDKVLFMEEAKKRISDIADFHRDLAEELWESEPTDDVYEETAERRFQSVETLVSWLSAAVEYQPSWVRRPLTIASPWLARLTQDVVGKESWRSLHQTWVALVMKSVVGLSLALDSAESLAAVLGVHSSAPEQSEGAPMAITRDFTWPLGYHRGNSWLAFQDFDRFVLFSPTLRAARETAGLEEHLFLSVGSDMILGLARCVWEDANPGASQAPTDLAPYTYPAFARFYCNRIQWAARKVDASESFQTALGFRDEDFRHLAENWYPRLVLQLTSSPRRTCTTWDAALGAG